MDYIWYIGALFVSGLVLTSGAQMVARAVAHISRAIHLTGYSLSFLLLGLCTSAPEMFVAYRSIGEGVPQLSVGNLIGGSILLLSLVMGISSVFYGKITLSHNMLFKEIVYSSMVVVAPAFVLWDGSLTRIEGAMLLGVYIAHALVLQKETTLARQEAHLSHKPTSIGKSFVYLVIGLLLMLISSHVVVSFATQLIAALHIPAFVFGLVLLSLGTNLPEFALAWQAGTSKTKSIAFGDLLGSAAANTPILGVLGLVSPFSVANTDRMVYSLVLLVAVTAFFVWALSSRKDISRKEGLGLLVFYGLFIVFEFFGR